MIKQYLLLTPGPITTTKTVKQQMLFDRSTWSIEYKNLTQQIRFELLKLANATSDQYTTVLIQGSGTFAVESVMHTAIKKNDKSLILVNGAYGERIIKIADYIGLSYKVHRTNYDIYPNIIEIKKILEQDNEIKNIIMVHCETTSGILNPLDKISQLAQQYNKTLIIDAMSSFGGIPINLTKLKIDYLISSSNKCIHGVPGFSFIIANKQKLEQTKNNSKSLSLDLYDQWKVMEQNNGKWRYTSPTHVVAAFYQAIKELIAEGGIEARFNRYLKNNNLLRARLEKIGLKSFLTSQQQSPIITTFLYPNNFDFNDFHSHMARKGFFLYPGKLMDINTFRIGNIGEVYPKDINKLCELIENYLT